MLFNSYPFILFFLPVTLAVFFILGHRDHRRLSLGWLVLASLFFYGWWNPKYVALILGAIVFNFAVGSALSRHHATGARRAGRALLALGIAANLALLGYFKYANFFAANLNGLLGTRLPLETVVLPLGISFFTFQKIAYLVDAHRGEAKEYDFVQFCLFVTFYPQLIAGPITHHREIIPQFAHPAPYRFSAENLAAGIAIFVAGLAKKVLIADAVAEFVAPVFDAAAHGQALTCVEAWSGVLAYAFQIYFDFSGYSDMCLGLGRMIGIRIPINFNSPYQAANIIDFWRRWHMTLSRFLRDYLYIPLGGSRHGPVRRYANLGITMLLGGLWHGASWTFVIWGGLHGLYLVVNHGWRTLRGGPGADDAPAARWAGRLLTFAAVLVAWVFFRAAGLASAAAILKAMAGAGAAAGSGLLKGRREIVWLTGLLLVCWFAPNTQEWAGYAGTGAEGKAVGDPARYPAWARWRPSRTWAMALAAVSLFVLLSLTQVSEFLYFQF